MAYTDGMSIQLPNGLPLSYPQGSLDLRMTLDGWFGVAQPRSELAPEIAGDGATAIGPWDFNEAYYVLRGLYRADDQSTLLAFRAQLLAALPANADVPITVLSDYRDQVAYVRLYDKPEIDVKGTILTWTMPLVATDPWKYSAEALTGQFGVFTGSNWYMAFSVNTVPNPDRYYAPFVLDTAPSPDRAYMTFIQQQSTSAYPPAAVLTSDGDITSRRLKFEVTGPLVQGDWKIVHEQSGNELWVDIGLTSGQSIILDCYAQSATLAGASVDNLVFGDWPTLLPGANTYRLVAGNPADGFANVYDAMPAYR